MVIKHMISTRSMSKRIVKAGVYVSLSTEPQNITATTCAQLLKTQCVDQKHNRSKNINNL